MNKTASQCDNANVNHKQLLKTILPYGMLSTKKWLMAQGLSTHSIDNSVKSGTLLILATGVYSQYTRCLSWEGVVASLQRMETLQESVVPSIIVGGLSALSLSGLSQYLPYGAQPHIHLYAAGKTPSWLRRLSLPITFEEHRASKLWTAEILKDKTFIKKHEWSRESPPVYFSCPEKAIIEILMSLPDYITFEHADELMQGLVNLSPRKLDKLLKSCLQIKVKRLFFWLAKRQNHPWFTKLNVDDYNLGSGKRVISKGGKLDKDYLITVPSHMTETN